MRKRSRYGLKMILDGSAHNQINKLTKSDFEDSLRMKFSVEMDERTLRKVM